MSHADRQRLIAYLGHILEAIERCQEYVEDMDQAAFLADRKTQDAVIRTFEVIGEASCSVPAYLRLVVPKSGRRLRGYWGACRKQPMASC